MGFSNWTVLIGRTGFIFGTTSSIPDPTLTLTRPSLKVQEKPVSHIRCNAFSEGGAGQGEEGKGRGEGEAGGGVDQAGAAKDTTEEGVSTESEAAGSTAGAYTRSR